MFALRRFLWEPYTRSLERRPLFTKMCTASGLMALGDVCAQNIEHYVNKKKKSHDSRYKILDKAVPGTGKVVTIKKIAADQLVFTPVSLAAFLGILSGLEGKSWPETKEKIKRDYLDILLVNWTVWPGAQIINFTLIPPSQRVLYVTILGIFWNSFLSYMGNR